MSLVIERIRSLHEDIERAEHKISDLLLDEPKGHKERLTTQHQIAHLLSFIRERQEELASRYADEDQSKKEETNSIVGEGPALFSAFYDRLKETRDYHRKFPDIEITSGDPFQFKDVPSLFSGEESTGRYLDLHQFYDLFINLSRTKSVIEQSGSKDSFFDYTKYLHEFYLFDDDSTTKKDDYVQYLTSLYEYLKGFCERSDPLEDTERFIKQIEEDFSKMWGSVSSWDEIRKSQGVEQSPTLVRPKEEKEEQNDDPLYCIYCKRRFAKQSVYDAHLEGKKHKRAVLLYKSSRSPDKSITSLEYRIFRLGVSLQKVVERTVRNIEAKQAKNWEEIQADMDEESEEEVSSEEEDDEDEIVQGIRDYPVGWDGKPIPFWLYKLHGLGVEYKCEICGNHTYMGRRNFEMHFQEWRHAQGLKYLGISNTKHFSEITKIKDALALQKKIQSEKKLTQWNEDDQMEFEDHEGNVMSKKTYELMQKQGLL
eukprot:CAMPEP_0201512980 /NCGR_PEP_ID=MMETSP0161_2-20130828/5127_1 /ASSEMBLY_ACC=CAM_ASM_000251 /TAXON_ID=180227 /ORGANISM="Neoparamoeba aestuarina, Strain SoJaBio B1-5/56/2" /LENGTH=482 /DNA_ID=CAMNT_0047909023 /DNA_START=80 /DNA_END=1528 /DNA_ORIENTATION=+